MASKNKDKLEQTEFRKPSKRVTKKENIASTENTNKTKEGNETAKAKAKEGNKTAKAKAIKEGNNRAKAKAIKEGNEKAKAKAKEGNEKAKLIDADGFKQDWEANLKLTEYREEKGGTQQKTDQATLTLRTSLENFTAKHTSEQVQHI